MSLFQRRGLNITESTGNALGSLIKFTDIGQEFPIAAMWLVVTATPTAVMANDNADGILNLVKRVKLSVQDGGQNRVVVDANGPSLIEYFRQIGGALSATTMAAINVDSTSAKTIIYPIPCVMPNVSDPIGSLLLLPVHRYTQKPILEVQLASQAEMDVSAPTFAVAAGVSVRLVVQRSFVNIAGQPFLNWELVEQDIVYPGTRTQVRSELPVPGAFTGLLLRGYTSNAIRADVTGNGNLSINIAGSDIFQTRWRDLAEINEHSIAPLTGNQFGGVTLPDRASVFFDFLSDGPGADSHDFGSLLNVNGLAGSGIRAQIVHDYTYTGTTTKLGVLYHRILGDITPMIAGKRV